MTAPCLVTGTLTAPTGAALPGATVTFRPARAAPRAYPPAVVAQPTVVTATADAGGVIAVSLLPGIYSAQTVAPTHGPLAPWLVDVPAAASADLATITVPLPYDLSSLDAHAAARRAEQALGGIAAALFVTDQPGVLTIGDQEFALPAVAVGGIVASAGSTTAAVTIGGATFTFPTVSLEAA